MGVLWGARDVCGRGGGSYFSPSFFVSTCQDLVRSERISIKVFLQVHLDIKGTQICVHTTEDEEKSNVNTNCKDSLLNTYKTNKIIKYIFSFCFSLKWHSML